MVLGAVGAADRARGGRPAGGDRRGRRRPAHLLRRRGRPPRRLSRRPDVQLRPGPAPDPLAEPDRGRELRVRRAHEPASAERARSGRTRSTASSAGRRWTVRRTEPGRAVLEHVLHPQPGYPFTLALAVEYALSESGLRVQTTATNVGADPCPYGEGAHPYLTVGTETIDPVVLRIPARTVTRSDERNLPVAQRARRGHRVRLPLGQADRRDRAQQRLHRPRARRATASPGSSSTTRAAAAG